MTVETLPISEDPSFEVLPEEEWEQRDSEARSAPDYVKLGVLLGAGFIVWRTLIKDSMPELSEPTDLTIRQALDRAVGRFTPIWLRATVPALERAYELGSHGALDPEELSYLANVYAKEMGSYVHETSAKALLEGFNALVNRKWSPQVAYRRAVEGVGLTSDGMKTYIQSMENITGDYLPTALTDDPRVQATLSKLLGQRSLSIGENEAYTVQEMGRQLMWMRAAEEGMIPTNSRRMWRTAKDERVCPTCAPMNEEIVGLYDKFDVGGQEYWNPALHPNCRCWVELIEPEELSKAYDPMRTPRGGNAKNRGQFSRNWGPKTKTMDPEASRAVDQLIADALKAKPKTFETKELKTFQNKGLKTFESKKLDLNASLSSKPAFSLETLKTKELSTKTFTPNPELSLRQAMILHYKKKPPLRLAEPPETFGPKVMVLGLYAFEYQSEDYRPGDTLEGKSIAHPLVDNQEMAFQLANDFADHLRGAIYSAMEVSPQLKRVFTKYLSDELTGQLSDIDDGVLAEMYAETGEEFLDVYDDRDAVVHEIREYLVEPHISPVPASHDENAQLMLKNYPELMTAHDDALGQVMVDLLENHDPATTEAARQLIPEIFPMGVPYDEGGTTVRALIPTVYIVEDPTEAAVMDMADIDMMFARSRPYAIDGEYEVTHVSYDSSPTDFHEVQMVYLRRRTDVEKRLDPFGVIRLAVKSEA